MVFFIISFFFSDLSRSLGFVFFLSIMVVIMVMMIVRSVG